MYIYSTVGAGNSDSQIVSAFGAVRSLTCTIVPFQKQNRCEMLKATGTSEEADAGFLSLEAAHTETAAV